MKFLVFAIVVLSAASTPKAETSTISTLEDVGKIANGETFALECLIESGIKLDSLASLATSSDLDTPNSQLKCLLKCFFEKTGFMDKEGKLQEDVITEQLSLFTTKDRIDALVKNCNFQEPDACETAYKVTECYFQNKAGLF
ncbi:general odorant-binding protein 56d-like [Anopheles ziemanni]|uniref:general odorant-binding protein 56d-like n=1 Tax=Anopheles coustani TaxID=139045 RepID=UPI0026597363|nr:general odorant-binding protein 56d-like [Anopheles coustani]XP_058170672.1 general odorant-binding protein 56d-like [Anopheles ziemanni]